MSAFGSSVGGEDLVKPLKLNDWGYASVDEATGRSKEVFKFNWKMKVISQILSGDF